jgi:hypothetical protein
VKAAVDQKAPIIINSASGDIAHFEDGADNMPVKQLTVNVEPIQDLHGYDSPWPAGGGKNLIDDTIKTIINNEYLAIGATNLTTYPFRLMPGSFTMKAFGAERCYGYIRKESDTSNIIVINGTSSGTFTISEEANYRIWFYGSAYISDITHVMLVAGETAPTTFSPYSNICPISGRTSATVTRTGRNLLNSSIVHGIWTPAGWYDHENYNTKYLSTRYAVPVVGGKTYCFSLKNDSSNPAASGSFIAFANGNAIGETETWFSVANGIINVPSGADSIVINIVLTNNFASISDVSATDFQLELGSTASAYEPYQGNTYTITLGDTVYGGSLDVTAGKMVVDRAMKVFSGSSSEGWFKSDYGYFCTEKISGAIDRLAARSDFQSNLYAYGVIANNSSTLGGCLIWGAVRVRLADMSISLDDWKAQLASTPMQVVYTLATPIEITLTPTQIETLIGQNNVWSDAGEVDVDYPADTKLYVDKKIAAAIAAALNA